MTFGRWFLALFLPPIYFFVRGKPGAGVLNGIGLLFSAVLIPVFGIGLFGWLVCVAHACIDLHRLSREEEMQRQAELIAEKTRAGAS